MLTFQNIQAVQPLRSVQIVKPRIPDVPMVPVVPADREKNSFDRSMVRQAHHERFEFPLILFTKGFAEPALSAVEGFKPLKKGVGSKPASGMNFHKHKPSGQDRCTVLAQRSKVFCYTLYFHRRWLTAKIFPSVSLNQAVLAPPPVAILFFICTPGMSYSSNTTPRL